MSSSSSSLPKTATTDFFFSSTGFFFSSRVFVSSSSSSVKFLIQSFAAIFFSAQASAWALDQHLLNHQHSVSVSPQHPILLHPLHRPSPWLSPWLSPWRPLSPWAQPLASVLPSLLASLHLHQGSHYFQLPRWHVFSWALEKLLLLQSSPFSLQFHYLHRLHLPPHSDLQCSHYHHCPDHRHQAKLHSFLQFFFPRSFCLCLRLCLCTGFLIFH